MKGKKFITTDYLVYRCNTRNFELAKIEFIVKHSSERYFDTETRRKVVIGNYNGILVLIPYEEDDDFIKPITVHAISRKQIRFRLNTGRFV